MSSPSRLKVKKEKVRLNLESHEWYRAKFLNAEIKEGQYGEYCRFSFEVLSGYMEDGETKAKGTLTSALCDAEVCLGSKMYEYVSAILGYEPDLDDDLDITPFYGDTFEVNILTEKKKGAEKAHSNVVKIRKPKKKKSEKKKK